MANHKSAAKRAKQNENRRLRNKAIKSATKTAIKKVLSASETGENSEALFCSAQSQISKAAKKGVLHKNTAARKISRLAKTIKRTA